MSDVEAYKKQYQSDKDYWSAIYSQAKDDLNFISGKPGSQWDDRDYAARTRKSRPALQIDRLTQYVNQVSNDIRMNTPSINVIPHGGGSDIETAEIFQGIIRDIEDKSSADDAYDYAVNSAIKCSIGFIRVGSRYKDSTSFDQELYIERVVNPLSVILDPSSTSPDGSDAKRAWVTHEMTVAEFKSKYPDAEVSSFDGDGKAMRDEDMVTVCEYFEIVETPVTLAQLRDGSVIEYVDGMPYDVQQTRVSAKKSIKHCHLSGAGVIEETTFPGQYIPLVPVYGEEAWIDGVRHINSLFRKAKDSQRMYNYLASTHAELLKKAPKATIIAVGGTTEAYAEDYKDPDSAIVLRYDQTDSKGNPAPAPNLNPGPQVPTGIVNAMAQAADDIKATLGLYDAFVGQRSNETSGVAIKERKMEGDRAVYHFGDNLVRSLTQVGRIIVTALPDVKTGPEIVSIIGKEEDSDTVGINGAMVEGQERPYFLSQGQYNVTVTTGASYATMRQEAAEFFQQVIQSQPEMMQVAGDLLFKYMDFPGAQALSERMKKTIPPNLLEDSGQDPQVAALQQENEALKAQLQAAASQADDKQAELQIKAQSEQSRASIDLAKLNLEREKMEKEFQIKRAELALKAAEIESKEEVARQQGAAERVPQSSGFMQEREDV